MPASARSRLAARSEDMQQPTRKGLRKVRSFFLRPPLEIQPAALAGVFSGSTTPGLRAAHRAPYCLRFLLPTTPISKQGVRCPNADIPSGAHMASLALWDAAEGGDLSAVIAALEAGRSQNNVSIDGRKNGRTPLMAACQSCRRESAHLAVVEYLIAKGADVNSTTDGNERLFVGGTSPLMIACQHYLSDLSLRMATALIDAGSKVNCTNDEGGSALSIASYCGHAEVVRLLIAKGANVNNKDRDSFTPLMCATDKGYCEAASILVNCGACIDARDRQNRTALDIALGKCAAGQAHRRHGEIVEMLIRKGAKVDFHKWGSTLLALSLERGVAKEIESLLGRNVDVNCTINGSDTPLIVAARKGSVEIVRMLVAKGADVNKKNQEGASPLGLASRGHKDAVEVLIRAGADVNTKDNAGSSPLAFAASLGCKEIVAALVRGGADVNMADNCGVTPIGLASQGGHDEIVEMLINARADVNVRDGAGGSPLGFASSAGHRNVVLMLVKHGANVNTRNNEGGTPLGFASSHGHAEIAHALVREGADVNSRDKNGDSPLAYASGQGHREVVDMLIGGGADANATSNDGLTPLMYASSQGHREIVDLLVRNGANVGARDKKGRTAVKMASAQGHRVIVRMLKKARGGFWHRFWGS